MSQVCVASSFPELTENIQTVLIVTKFKLDIIIQHYGPLGIIHHGTVLSLPSAVPTSAASGFEHRHDLNTDMVQVVVSVSEPLWMLGST